MERILVTITEQTTSWEVFSHGCSLARRIDAKLDVLFVASPSGTPKSRSEMEQSKEARARLELMLEAAKAEGVKLEYFVTEGNYAEEVISFVRDNKTSLLVLEHNGGDAEEVSNSLLAIRHRISCRVELVAPKKNNPQFISKERMT